jgi:ProP effector
MTDLTNETSQTNPAEATPASPDRPASAQRGGRPRPQGQRQPQAARPQKATRPVNPVLQRLFELYPKQFGAKFLPLKLGVFQDLLERHPEDFKKDELKVAMGQHARSTPYLESVAAGLPRHDLEGNPVEPVAPEHVHHAILEIFRRRQARSREDLRPRLMPRLMQAIEASGLSREDYAALVRVQDEATNALVDGALAEMAVQAAKREALLRAFEASGKTEAEFADMYGMNPAEVMATLARVRSEQAAKATDVAP